jgi:hypothetical protein
MRLGRKRVLPCPCISYAGIANFFVQLLFLSVTWLIFLLLFPEIQNKQTNSVARVRERTIPTERPPLANEVSANFWGQRVSLGQRDGSLWPYSRFLSRSRSFLFEVAPQLYSRGWVDPVPGPILRKSGSAGNRTWSSGSVARNSDH